MNNIGYPLHVVCEIYSSKNQKWYVIDPSFGSRFKRRSYMIISVQLKYVISKVSEGIAKLNRTAFYLTKKSIVGKDYFKFYENVIFTNHVVEKQISKESS